MKNKKKYYFKLLIAAVVVAILLILKSVLEPIAKVYEHEPLLANLISFFVVVCGLMMEKHVKVLVKDIPFLAYFFNEEKKEIELTLNERNRIKRELLIFTEAACKQQMEILHMPELFTEDFPLDADFIPGTDTPNDSKEWQRYYDNQFAFITGPSGNGKTYELLRRAIYCCTQLAEGKSNDDRLTDRKIPVYIELRSLDQPFSREWLINYIQRTAQTLGQQLDAGQIGWLLDHKEVFYFFDGLDEVLNFADASAAAIVSIFHDTGVCVSCRDDRYQELLEADIIKVTEMPAEWQMLSLTQEWVQIIIGYLNETEYNKEEKAELSGFVQTHPGILELISSPIMLNIFLVAYHSMTAEEKKELADADPEKAQLLVWQIYEDVIARKKLKAGDDILGIRTYSIWIAKIVQSGVFFIESIQPDWLYKIDKKDQIRPSFWLQRCFYLFTRVIAAMVVGLAIGCICCTPLALLSDSVVGGIVLSVAAGIYQRKRARWFPQWLANFVLITGMTVALIAACGVYQGFCVPRLPAPAIPPWFAVSETWPGIVLAITLAAIFSYRILLEKSRQQYILPVEIFHFDWIHAIGYGFSWGFLSAMIVGVVAVATKISGKNVEFINHWLIPTIKTIGKPMVHGELTESQVNVGVFLYGFCAMFMVATVVIICLAGRYSDKEEKDAKKKQELNFAIKKSFRHAVRNASYVLLISVVFYQLMAFKFNIADIVHSITFPIGMFIFAFLWFGGMEGINHVILRANLYFRGIAPENYDKWMNANKLMRLITPSGYQTTFRHKSLHAYYRNYPTASVYDVPRAKFRKQQLDFLFYIAVFLVLLMIAGLPFYFRYGKRDYWLSSREVIVKNDPGVVTRTDDSTYQLQKSGKLVLTAHGFINVGTFVGWAWPSGTQNGFMGMPLGKNYDIPGFEQFNHAALLYRYQEPDGSWTWYKPVATSFFNDSTVIKNLKKGTRIRFIVNDKEFQNNTGHYRLTLKIE